ncbi:hypothetical protein IZU27_09575 [Treponema socranskii]|uniref:hypothetical protein n=1 Tax=Treponema socranskii TaxID=53419 RepID=UPI003D8FFF8E
MKTSNYARKILTGAALFMLFTGLFTGCPQNIEDKAVSVESVRLDKTELDLGVEESYKLSAAITPAELKVIKDKKWKPIKYSRGYEEEI